MKKSLYINQNLTYSIRKLPLIPPSYSCKVLENVLMNCKINKEINYYFYKTVFILTDFDNLCKKM